MTSNRRVFLGTAGLLATTGLRASAGVSERVRIGVVGVRGRGNELAQGFARSKQAEVVAVCDIDDA